MRLLPTTIAVIALLGAVAASPAAAETVTATGSLIMKDKYGTQTQCCLLYNSAAADQEIAYRLG